MLEMFLKYSQSVRLSVRLSICLVFRVIYLSFSQFVKMTTCLAGKYWCQTQSNILSIMNLHLLAMLYAVAFQVFLLSLRRLMGPLPPLHMQIRHPNKQILVFVPIFSLSFTGPIHHWRKLDECQNENFSCQCTKIEPDPPSVRISFLHGK